MDPLKAMLEGQRLVRENCLIEGIVHLHFALNEFSDAITRNGSDVPELYLFVEDCYLFMMSASFASYPRLNLHLTMDRQRFHEKYNVRERIKGVSYPVGYVMMDGRL